MVSRIYFWSELLSLTKLERLLSSFSSYDFGINLAIDPSRFNRIKPIVKKCQIENIELNLWPLLSRDQGYWINLWNLNLQKDWINRILSEYPSISAILLDLEKPINFTGIKGILKLRKLERSIPKKVVQDKLESLVDLIHDNGKDAVSTSYGGIPLGLQPRPSNADFYSYMIYLSFIMRFSSIETRKNIIHYCASKIIKDHGLEKSAIDLGLTYAGVVNQKLMNFLGLLDLDELVDHISVCLHSGIRRIQIFSIDNFYKSIDDVLEKMSSIKPHAPPVLSRNKGKGFMLKAYRRFLFPKKKDLGRF